MSGRLAPITICNDGQGVVGKTAELLIINKIYIISINFFLLQKLIDFFFIFLFGI